MSSKQIKIGAILSYAALALSCLITLIYTPYVLRMLGQAEYGLFALVNSIIVYVTILDFGFGNAIVRYTAKYHAEGDRESEAILHGMFMVLYIGIGIISFCASLILIGNLDRLFSASLSASEIKTAKILMSLAACNTAFSFPFSIFAAIITAYERFAFARAIYIVRLLINPLSMVLVLHFGYRSIGMILAATIVNLFFNIANLIYCKRNLSIKLSFARVDFLLLKEISVYSFFNFLYLLVDRMYWYSGQFLLGLFDSAAAVSVFAVAMQFVTLLYMNLSAAIAGLFLPRVIQLSVSAAGQEALANLFNLVGRIQWMILALALTGFTLYGRQFITLWAGIEYCSAYWVALINMIPLTIPLIQNVGIAILQAENRHAFNSVTHLGIAVLNLIIAIPLIKMWGPVGAAIGTALSLTIGDILIMNSYYAVVIHLNIKRFWLEIAKLLPAVILPFGIGVSLLQVFSADRIFGLIASVCVYSMLFCASLFLLGMNRYEKDLIMVPIKKLAAKYFSIRGYAA